VPLPPPPQDLRPRLAVREPPDVAGQPPTSPGDDRPPFWARPAEHARRHTCPRAERATCEEGSRSAPER
jgi:hypothetical protein